LVATALCGSMSLMSCHDGDDDINLESEGNDTVYVTPTTDQMAVQSAKTLYLPEGLVSSKKGDNDCVLDNLLNRFKNKLTLTDSTSLAAMTEGDYMLLYMEKSDIANVKPELKAAIKTFAQKGGILVFLETSSECIDEFVNNSLELNWAVQPDDDKYEDIMHVFYVPVNGHTLHFSHFEDFPQDQVENANGYSRGLISDKMLTETSEWVQDMANASRARTVVRKVDGEKKIIDLQSSLSFTHHDSRTIIKVGYQTPSMVNGNRTDLFDFMFHVWAIKADNGDRYFYVEMNQNLDFGSASIGEYVYRKGLKIYKINEWWGHWFDWNMHVFGPKSSNVTIEDHGPHTTETSKSISSGISWSASGTGTCGMSGGGDTMTQSATVGLNVSKTRTIDVTDVTYYDRTGSHGTNHVGGRFNLAECEAYADTGIGLVSISKGAGVAHSTFCPFMSFIAKVDKSDPNKDNVTLHFGYTIELISYRGWNAVAYGVTETDTRECDGTVDIDLSRIKYPK